jgi:hypothetical protein
MDMILRDVPFLDRDFVVAVDFVGQLSDSEPGFICQYQFRVLRDSDKVQMNLERGMRGTPLIF